MPSTWKTGTQTTIDFPKKKFPLCRAVTKEMQGSPPRDQKQPLSPRKRLGVENLCNVPQPLECSPTKRKKENQPLALSTPRGRKLEFGESPLKPTGRHRSLSAHKSPERTGCPLNKGDETPCSENHLCALLSPIARHLKQQVSGACYLQTKQVLNTTIPERLLARERETEAISRFITDHISEEKPGSLYISGAPGTGKTACVERIMEDMKVLESDVKAKN